MQWKPVSGWPYEVSDAGLVRRQGAKQPLKPMRSRYSAVRLCSDGVQQDAKVHVLVLEAFVGPRPAGKLGCHADDDTLNNKLSNLYWGTYSDNTRDRCHKYNTLTDEQAQKIKSARRRGVKGNDLAQQYGVSPQLVCDIFKGRSYSYVT